MPRALSLLWPWSALVVRGLKHVETRKQPLGLALNEDFFIHESRGDVDDDIARDVLRAAGRESIERNPGCVVGEVRAAGFASSDGFMPESWLSGATKEERIREYALGNYAMGRHLILMDEAAAFLKPVRARGMPGLWTPDRAIVDGLRVASRRRA